METREEMQSAIEALRRQRGFEKLHNRPFDDGLITAAEQKLQAFEDLEAVKREASATALADQRSAEILAHQTRLCQLVADHLADIDQAQEALRIAAGAFGRMLERMPLMARAHRAVTNASPPVCLQELELAR